MQCGCLRAQGRLAVVVVYLVVSALIT
jgi:hypothetical protein